MNSPIGFRAGPNRPCPICASPTKGCSATVDGLHLCRGEPADPSAWKCVKRGDPFNSYRRVDDRHHERNGFTKESPTASRIDWTAQAETYAKNLTPELRNELAQLLGLTSKYLFQYMPLLGWSGSAWTFPECDGSGRIIGILLRDRAGKKLMQKGSKRGLTIPVRWDKKPGPVFVVEGPTCAIAAASAGLSAVGRPANSSGAEHLADLRDLDPERPIIVVGENDQKPDGSWPGRDGPESIARRLTALLGRSVLKAMPPAEAKDVRDWLISQARGDAPWPDRGRELREYLTANAVTVEPPVDLSPSASTVPPYQPFPVEALPPALREFVEETAIAVGCDPAFAALPALTLVGAAAGAAVVVSPKRKFREPPALWCCVVADSGTGKSPALKPFADLAFAIDRRMRATYVAELSRYEGGLKAWKDANGDPDDKPAKPVREHFAVIDTTIERLAEMLGDSTRGLFLLRDELGGWFGSFTRYKGKGGGSDVPNWLSLFDAGPIRVHRRTGEPRDIEVDRGFISVCGGIQSEILRFHLNDPEYVASGLASRIMFAMPPKACPRWTDVELSAEVEMKFTAVLEQFRSIPFDPVRGPIVLNLAPAALARFKQLNNEFAERAEGVEGGPMSAVLPKAVRFALRLALVHHLLVNAAKGRPLATGVVSLESMQAGELLARWFVGEAERVYAMLAERPGDRAARGLADLVRRKGGRLRARDLQRSNAGRYPTAAVAEHALDGLVSAGLGEWVVEPPGAKGGAPGKVFVLHQSDTRQNPTPPPPSQRGDLARSPT